MEIILAGSENYNSCRQPKKRKQPINSRIAASPPPRRNSPPRVHAGSPKLAPRPPPSRVPNSVGATAAAASRVSLFSAHSPPTSGSTPQRFPVAALVFEAEPVAGERIAGDYNKQDLRCTQEPIPLPTFTTNTWSYLLWSPVIVIGTEHSCANIGGYVVLITMLSSPPEVAVVCVRKKGWERRAFRRSGGGCWRVGMVQQSVLRALNHAHYFLCFRILEHNCYQSGLKYK